MPEGLLNNVDVVEGLSVGGRPQVVLGASDRTPGKTGISLYTFDPAGTGRNGVRYWGAVATDVVEPYGFCLARRGAEVHAILVGHEGEVRQFVVTADVNGQPASREVRRFEIGSISEGCAADEPTDALFMAEENVGVWRYDLDPSAGARRTMIQPIAPGRLVADAEGLTIPAELVPEGAFAWTCETEIDPAANTALGRTGTPQDIADAVAYGKAGDGSPVKLVVYSAGGGANVAAEAIAYLLARGYAMGDLVDHFAVVQHGNNWVTNYEDEARELVEAGAAAEDGPAARAVTAELVATHDATDAP